MRALLIVAPFGLIEYPNLAVSLLKALATRAGFACDVHYCSLEFAREVGWNTYRLVYNTDPQLLMGERLFAPALFGDAIPSWTRYWSEVVEPYDRPLWRHLRAPEGYEANSRGFEALQERARSYVDAYAARTDLADYDVIGFSTSYSQNLASLAIARRLKARFPGTTIVFGGANCHGAMGEGLLRAFPFIDYVCTEEGDHAFPALLAALGRGGPVSVPGIVARAADGSVPASGRPTLVESLDTLPYPDFSDYFAAFRFRPSEHAAPEGIPMETSRGCWWGEKHHCTFCGLNGQAMRFRSKSPTRVADELRTLVERWGVRRVMMTDNIMDNRFVADLLPHLAATRVHEQIFFELKANLRHRDVELLARAGITHLQPGLESLSTHVLGLMDKGCDAFQNLQLLKWGKEFGLRVSWNLLCGFPGETAEDYDAVAALVPRIYHFQPALGFAQISIDRFSPMFTAPEDFGIRIAPAVAYRYVYALPEDVVRTLAYTFTFEGPATNTWRSTAPPPYARRAYLAYLAWRRFHDRADFSWTTASDGAVVLHDTRPCAEQEHTQLDPLEGAVFVALDEAQTPASLAQRLAEAHGIAVPADVLTAVLARFDARGWVYAEDGKFLALANRRPAGVARDSQARAAGPS